MDPEFWRILAMENRRFGKDVVKMIPFLIALFVAIFLVIELLAALFDFIWDKPHDWFGAWALKHPGEN